MTDDEQIALWVEGKPTHNDPGGASSECCPDFSCCHPELLQPIEVRRAYQRAPQRTREVMLAPFLAALMKKMGRVDVRIVGILEQGGDLAVGVLEDK